MAVVPRPTAQTIRLTSLPGRQTVTLATVPTSQTVRLRDEDTPDPRYHTFHLGTGTLSAAVKVKIAAVFAGAGAFVPAVKRPDTLAAFAGMGTLAAAVSARVSAALTGSGSATATAARSAPVGQQGTGALSATARVAVSALFSGSGSLAAFVGEAKFVAANFTGSGVAAAAAEAVRSVTAGFAGSGSLSATVTTGPPKFDVVATSQGNGNRSVTLPASTTGQPRTVIAMVTKLVSNTTVNTPTVGGSPMTFIAERNPGGGEGYVGVWRLDNVPAAAQTVAWTSGDNYTNLIVAGYGAGPTVTGIATAGGSSTVATTGAIAVGAAETLICCAFMKEQPTVTNGTTRGSIDHSSGYIRSRFLEGAGASPQTCRLTQSAQTYSLVWFKIS